MNRKRLKKEYMGYKTQQLAFLAELPEGQKIYSQWRVKSFHNWKLWTRNF